MRHMTPRNRLLVFSPVNVTGHLVVELVAVDAAAGGTNGHGILHCSSATPSAVKSPETMF